MQSSICILHRTRIFRKKVILLIIKINFKVLFPSIMSSQIPTDVQINVHVLGWAPYPLKCQDPSLFSRRLNTIREDLQYFKIYSISESSSEKHEEKILITRTFQFRSLFRVNQAALHAVLKPENMSIVNFRLCARFKYVSNSYYPVSNRSLDHCFHSFRSLFESISIDYKALELNYLQLSAAFFGIGELPSRAL